MSDDNEHTPGPWLVFPGTLRTMRGIRTCYGLDTADGQIGVCYVGEGISREADARLMAAAPELLAGLRYARQVIREGKASASEVERLIDGALAKATGIESARSNGCKLSDGHWRRWTWRAEESPAASARSLQRRVRRGQCDHQRGRRMAQEPARRCTQAEQKASGARFGRRQPRVLWPGD